MKDLMMATRDMAWWDNAPCKGVDNKVFFPESKKGHSSKHIYDDALAICEACQYRADCLEFAMEAEVNDIRRYGVYGGMTPSQREEYFAGRIYWRK